MAKLNATGGGKKAAGKKAAGKKATGRKAQGKSAEDGRDMRESEERAVADAMLTLVAAHGWRQVTLPDIAAEAGIDPGRMRLLYNGKVDILIRHIRHIDGEVLGRQVDFAADESVRDRLFDLLMRRLDALAPHKAGLQSCFEALTRDPFALPCLAPRSLTALGWYLDAAGASANGPAGSLRIAAMGVLWLGILRVWFGDDSADAAKTMAALDKGLARAEQMAGVFERFPGTAANAPGTDTAAGHGADRPGA